MKEFYYVADCGGLMLGNDTFKCHYSNCVGDGDYKVFVNDELGYYPEDEGWHFIDSIEGVFNIYDYDGSYAEPIVELNGRYGIYCKCGNMFLQKWSK